MPSARSQNKLKKRNYPLGKRLLNISNPSDFRHVESHTLHTLRTQSQACGLQSLSLPDAERVGVANSELRERIAQKLQEKEGLQKRINRVIERQSQLEDMAGAEAYGLYKEAANITPQPCRNLSHHTVLRDGPERRMSVSHPPVIVSAHRASIVLESEVGVAF